MKRLFLAFIALAFSIAVVDAARFPRGFSGNGTGGAFAQLKIGGGGFVTNLVIASDGKQFARTDTAGAFVRTSHSAVFTPALTSASMPSGDVSPGFMNGVCNIAIAPSNTNHLYMYFTPNNGASGFIYSSTDFAATWAHTTTQPNSSATCDPNDKHAPSSRLITENMAVSPANDNVLYFGSPAGGVWYTLDGGANWHQISTGTIPAGTSPYGNQIAFDPTDVTGNTVYISSYGSGIWKCTAATTSPSCTKLNSTGMPTTFNTLVVDQAGTVWVVDNSGANNTGNLLRYLSGAWTTQVALSGSNQNLACVAVNPADVTGNKVYTIDYHGFATYSVNAQAGTPTWTGPSVSWSEVSSVIGWMQWSADQSLGIGSCQFDPTQSNVLYAGAGVGVFTTTPPTTGTANVAWNGDQTQGVENLDLTSGMSLVGGGVFFTAQDRPLWAITNAATYPAKYFPNNTTEIRNGNGLCGNATANTYAGINANDGLTVSTTGPFGTYVVSGQTGLPGSFNSGGGCAMLTATNWVWLLNQAGLFQPYFTSNSGSGWGACTFGGSKTAGGGGWVTIAQDSTAPGTIVLYNDGTGSTNGTGAKGFWQSTSTSSCAFTQLSTTTPDSFGKVLIPVPGNACTFIFGSLAFVFGGLPSSQGNLFLTTNCGASFTNSGVAISNVSSVIAFGIGAANPAKDGFPAIYCQCYANDGSGSKFGFFEIDNVDATPFVTNLDAAQGGYPAGNFDFIVLIAGDLSTYGTIYGGFGDSGGFWRTLH